MIKSAVSRKRYVRADLEQDLTERKRRLHIIQGARSNLGIHCSDEMASGAHAILKSHVVPDTAGSSKALEATLESFAVSDT